MHIYERATVFLHQLAALTIQRLVTLALTSAGHDMPDSVLHYSSHKRRLLSVTQTKHSYKYACRGGIEFDCVKYSFVQNIVIASKINMDAVTG